MPAGLQGAHWEEGTASRHGWIQREPSLHFLQASSHLPSSGENSFPTKILQKNPGISRKSWEHRRASDQGDQRLFHCVVEMHVAVSHT